jgi:beta-RFAP synthase
MFSFGRTDVRQFGGVGVMIDRPGLRLRISPAERFLIRGPMGQRIAAVSDRLLSQWRCETPPACQIELLAAPPEHAGLGTGTQLELAVTAGLNTFLGANPLTAQQLAQLSGRGARSAIGTYGFLLGGLLVESGKLPGEILSPLEHHVALPTAWRFVLLTLPGAGLAGDAERREFDRLPPVPPEVTVALRAEVFKELLPAALDGQFSRFSESLYRFNREAGMCFAASQGGPYASSAIADLIERLRHAGVSGVGQSSWGPTVFALLENERAAHRLLERVVPQLPLETVGLVAHVVGHGASISTCPAP